MPYHLKHPEHGIHICYTPEDVEAHKLIGWVPVPEPKKVEGILRLNKPKVKTDGN